MTKPGKKALVPPLRFPEFQDTGGWKMRSLGEISDRITEKVADRKLTTVSITAGYGFVSQAEKFSRDISGKQYENYILLKKGEFSYNKGNSKKFPQGCVYKLKEFDEVAAPNAFISFKFKNNYVSDFYLGYFDNNAHGKQLTRYITSGARSDGLLNIRPEDFFSIILPTPIEKKEQQKIADCLSSIDDLITAQTQKLAALKAHKKGLMQQLFPAEGETVPELRFPEFRDGGEWDEIVLGKLVDIRSGFSPSKYNLAKKAKYAFLKVEDLNNCEKYQNESREYSDDLDGLVPVNSVIFPKRGAAILLNKVRINTQDVLMDTNLMAITPNKKILVEFLYYTIVSVGLFKIADTSTIPQINNKHINPYQILIPSKPEQQKIADCLASIDELITTQSQKIEALKRHKKGLMQQLFPSMDEVDG